MDPRSTVLLLDRDVVEGWVGRRPTVEADRVVEGLALRATAAWLASDADWADAADAHVRFEQEQGLDEPYAWAFDAAHRILHGYWLDDLVLALCPDAVEAITALDTAELEAMPTFDTYPRAAYLIGREHLPDEITDPALQEFAERFGDEEEKQLAAIVEEYVALDMDDVDRMVELTASLVFHAFPEAMGLAWADEDDDVMSTEDWPLRTRLPFNGYDGWDGLDAYLSLALAGFRGEAGLDYGDALVVGLTDAGIDGPHIAAFSTLGSITVQASDLDLDDDLRDELLAEGWEPFGNDPASLHKDVDIYDARMLAFDIPWILQRVVEDVEDVRLWARGTPVDAAQVPRRRRPVLPKRPRHEPRVAKPADADELISLVRDSLRDWLQADPDEYAPGRFAFEKDGIDVAVLANEELFPYVRFHHRVLEVPDDLRATIVDFANALHGRTSTMGTHWWLGGHCLWQVTELLFAKFDEEVFVDQLSNYLAIARERTPEIRGRFGPVVDGGLGL